MGDPLTGREYRDPLAKERKVDEARDQAAELNRKYSAVFDTGVGKDIMDDLDAQFGGTPIIPGDPYMTHARAGSQEVLLYIKERMTIPED